MQSRTIFADLSTRPSVRPCSRHVMDDASPCRAAAGCTSIRFEAEECALLLGRQHVEETVRP